MKEARHERLPIVWLHLYEISKKDKILERHTKYQYVPKAEWERRMTANGHNKDDGRVLKLTLGINYWRLE